MILACHASPVWQRETAAMMEKLAIKLTLTAVTTPDLLAHLETIEDAKHRAQVLRRLAEIGLQVLAAGGVAPPPVQARMRPPVSRELPPPPVIAEERAPAPDLGEAPVIALTARQPTPHDVERQSKVPVALAPPPAPSRVPEDPPLPVAAAPLADAAVVELNDAMARFFGDMP